MMPLIDFAGKTFGRLTVISRAENGSNKTTKWNCLCLCGNSIIAFATNLKQGRCQSCGCLQRELTIQRSTTHRQTKTVEHRAWLALRNRCSNPNNPAFKYYGARGIAVCSRWDSFENFLADMGPRPSQDLSIDRVDNDGNYEPGNCRWATRSQQRCNQRSPKRKPAQEASV